jgi:hypothetical protein
VLSAKQLMAQKIDYWSGTSTLFPWFGSEWLWLFPKIRSALKGWRFQDTEDIQKNVTMALKAILQQEFQKYFQHWQHCWAKCITA